MSRGDSLLVCDSITKRFGGTLALDSVAIDVRQGQIVGLIGPNGSGKSTLVNVVSGFYSPDSGQVRIEGRNVSGARPHELVRMGVGRTFQNLRLFEHLTVLDNVLIGLHVQYLAPVGLEWAWIGALASLPASRRRDGAARAAAARSLQAWGLAPVATTKVSQLPYGLRKRLELVRATASQPRLLLLDEPTAGLSPEEADEVMDLLRRERDRSGVALLVIEHRLEWVMEIADGVAVLDAGRKIADGKPNEIRSNPDVLRAYVGTTGDQS